MEIVIIWLLLALIPAYIAGQKGRSAIGFFALAILLSPLIALIIVVLIGSKKETAAPVVGVADEITKLTALRDSGALTEEEFQRQRAALLQPAAKPPSKAPSTGFFDK